MIQAQISQKIEWKIQAKLHQQNSGPNLQGGYMHVMRVTAHLSAQIPTAHRQEILFFSCTWQLLHEQHVHFPTIQVLLSFE